MFGILSNLNPYCPREEKIYEYLVGYMGTTNDEIKSYNATFKKDNTKLLTDKDYATTYKQRLSLDEFIGHIRTLSQGNAMGYEEIKYLDDDDDLNYVSDRKDIRYTKEVIRHGRMQNYFTQEFMRTIKNDMDPKDNNEPGVSGPGGNNNNNDEDNNNNGHGNNGDNGDDNQGDNNDHDNDQRSPNPDDDRMSDDQDEKIPIFETQTENFASAQIPKKLLTYNQTTSLASDEEEKEMKIYSNTGITNNFQNLKIISNVESNVEPNEEPISQTLEGLSNIPRTEEIQIKAPIGRTKTSRSVKRQPKKRDAKCVTKTMSNDELSLQLVDFLKTADFSEMDPKVVDALQKANDKISKSNKKNKRKRPPLSSHESEKNKNTKKDDDDKDDGYNGKPSTVPPVVSSIQTRKMKNESKPSKPVTRSRAKAAGKTKCSITLDEVIT